MDSCWIDIILTLVASALYSMLLLPMVLRVALRRNVFDVPGGRKHHNGAVPRLGGTAFLPAFVLTITTVTVMDMSMGSGEVSYIDDSALYSSLVVFLALAIVYVTGLYDDLTGVRYRTKFLMQMVCAVLLISAGETIDSLYGVLGIESMSPLMSWIFTAVMIVFVVNAVNLIDGIDGLAASLFEVAMLFYGIMFIYASEWGSAVWCFAGIGVTFPFLRYNIFGKASKRNKLFMGDCGSLTLGLMTVIAGIELLKTASENDFAPAGMNPAIMALAPIMIPCFDVVRVYFLRIRSHRSPFLPDRNHIHHRLLDLGLSSAKTLTLLVVMAVVLAVANLLLSIVININLLLLADIALWVVITHLVRNRKPYLSKLLNRR